MMLLFLVTFERWDVEHAPLVLPWMGWGLIGFGTHQLAYNWGRRNGIKQCADILNEAVQRDASTHESS